MCIRDSGGTVVAVALAVTVLPRAVEPFQPLSVAFVAALFLVCAVSYTHLTLPTILLV